MVTHVLGKELGHYPDPSRWLKYHVVIALRLESLEFSQLREYSCPINGPVLDAVGSKVSNNVRRWLKGMTGPLCRPTKFVLDIKFAPFTLAS